MKLAFTTSNLLRKEKFKVITMILENRTKLFVRKQAENKLAKSHIKSLVKSENLLKAKLPNFRFVKIIRQETRFVDFEYIDAPALSLLIEKALIYKNFDQVMEYILKGLAAIDEIETGLIDPYTNIDFVKLFDKNRDYQTKVKEGCSILGVIDLRFDNLLLDQDKLYLIDYEWVFEFPIPKSYLKFRSLFTLASTLQNIIDTLCSPDFPCYKLFNGLIIPKAWLDLLHLEVQDVTRFLSFENKFQNYVNLTSDNFNARDIGLEVVTKGLMDESEALSKLEKTDDRKLIKILILERAIEKLKKQIVSNDVKATDSKISKLLSKITRD